MICHITKLIYLRVIVKYYFLHKAVCDMLGVLFHRSIKSITRLPHSSVNIVCASSVNILLLRTRCLCFSLSQVLKLLILFPLVLSSSVHPSLGVHSEKWEDQHRIRRGHHLQPNGRQGQHLQGHEGVSSGVQRTKMLIQRKAGGTFEGL